MKLPIHTFLSSWTEMKKLTLVFFALVGLSSWPICSFSTEQNNFLLTIMPIIAATSNNTCFDGGSQTVMRGGLEWQRCDDNQHYILEDATTYCQSLTLGQHSDWRLPTKDELKSLVVCSNGHPTPLQDNDWDKNMMDNVYDSTCQLSGVEGNDTSIAYIHDFETPTIDSSFKAFATPYWTNTKTLSGLPPFQYLFVYIVNFFDGQTMLVNLSNESWYVRCVR